MKLTKQLNSPKTLAMLAFATAVFSAFMISLCIAVCLKYGITALLVIGVVLCIACIALCGIIVYQNAEELEAEEE